MGLVPDERPTLDLKAGTNAQVVGPLPMHCVHERNEEAGGFENTKESGDDGGLEGDVAFDGVLGFGVVEIFHPTVRV